MSGPAILLVEDSPADVALAQRALKKHGVTQPLVVARDGAEALDYLFAQGEFAGRNPRDLPRVVLLDLNLPKVGGIEVLRRIRSHEGTRLLPVVVLTSSQQEQDLLACYTEGVNSYVTKPVDYAEFSEALGQLSRYWLSLNRCATSTD